MRRTGLEALAVFACLISVGVGQDRSRTPGQAQQLATQLTTAGAASFDKHDAKLMLDYYLDDAEVFLVGKSESGYQTTAYRGRAEIEKLYTDVFKNAQPAHSRNDVEFARFLAADLLQISGTFKPSEDSDPLPFVQERVLKGDRWLIMNLRLYLTKQGN
jgi:hypothetical protein